MAQAPQNGDLYPLVTRAWLSTRLSPCTVALVNSAFCKRTISQVETEIVATTIAHGMTGEIQKTGVAKLSSAIQARLAKVPNKNATRRGPYLNGKGYKHRACTMSAKGKATTKSTK